DGIRDDLVMEFRRVLFRSNLLSEIAANSEAESTGDAGNVNVTAGALSIVNGGAISSNTLGSTASAGQVTVSAGSLTVAGGSLIRSEERRVGNERTTRWGWR